MPSPVNGVSKGGRITQGTPNPAFPVAEAFTLLLTIATEQNTLYIYTRRRNTMELLMGLTYVN